MKRTIGMTILLALVIGGCTLEDGNECQEGTPETYANNASDKCVKTSCIDGKFVEDTPYKYSCIKEDGLFSGYGECLNGDKKTDQSDPDKEYLCTDGKWKEIEFERQCDDGVTFQNSPKNQCVKTTCVKGREQKDESCQYSCLLDSLTNTFTGCGECVNNEIKCEEGTQYKCGNGKWNVDVPCTYGCNSDTNLCLVCINDSFQCIDSQIKTCINNTWEITKQCPLGCSQTGACIECENGLDRCEESKLETCINGTWSTVKTCSNGCNSEKNTCNSPKIPKAGDLCVPETFEEVCTGGIHYVCTANRVKEHKCNATNDKRCAETAHGHVCSLSEEYTVQCSAEKTYIGVNDVCKTGKQMVFLCDKDINGKYIAVEKSGPSVCVTHPPFGSYLLSCNSNDEEVETRCKSCDYDSDGNAVCITDDLTAEHHLDEPCNDPNARACDGDFLIKCNGTKYVAANVNEQGEKFSCGQVASNFYCDELRALSYAQCVQECPDDSEVGSQYYSVACKDNFIERSICQIGQSGKKGIFGGVLTPSICSAENVMKTCTPDSTVPVDKPCPGGCTMALKGSNYEAACSLQP